MSALLEYQREFAAMLLNAKTPALATVRLRDAGAIYRNNFVSNLSAALRDVYPVVQRLVGPHFFAQMARQYIAVTPSASGDIEEYGAAFGDFIAAYPPASGLVYLADVARLEWLCHRAFHAAQGRASATAQALETPYQQYGQLRFTLHPTCHLLESAYPIATIWRANQPDSRADDELIKLGGSAEYILLRRPIFEVELVTLSCAQFLAFQAIARGATLETAIDTASQIEAAFDIQQFMALLFAPGVAIDCRLPGRIA